MSAKSIYEKLCDIDGFREAMPRRAAHIQQKMEVFFTKVEGSAFIVNENNLAHLVFDYYTDIARIKPLHGIDNVNKEKIIAYTVYWICRRKPIQCVLPRINDKYAFINEAFATTYIRDELSNMASGQMVSDEFLKQIYYHLKYRLIDSQSIELIISAFKSGFALP